MLSSRQMLLLGVAYSAEANALFAAMTTPPTAARKTQINTLILALKASGIWSALDLFYVLAAADSQAARLNWKNPAAFTAVAVSSPTFAVDRGYTGDGAASRLRTQFTPSTNGVNFALNSASLWAYSLTDIASSNADVGSVTAPRSSMASRNSGDQTIVAVNDGTASLTANTSSIGFFGGSRVSSSVKRAWKNGAQLGTDFAIASTALATQEQWICGGNALQFSNHEIAIAAWGASLSGLESAFYNSIRSYLQSVGAV